MIKSRLLFTTTLITLGIYSSAEASKSLGLGEIVEKVISYQPALRIEKERLNEVDASQRKIVAAALPNVGAGIDYSRKADALNGRSVNFGGDSYNNYQGSIELTQPIFRGGTLWASRRAGKKEESIQKLNVEKTERDLIVDSIQLFHRVLLSQRNMETVERLIEIQKKLLKTAESRYRIGNESRLSVLQMKTQLALLQPQLTQARNDLSLLASELADLAGLENLTEISIRGRLGPWNFFLPKPLAARERPEWKSHRLAQDRLKDERAISFAKHLPQLDAYALLSRSGFERSDLADNDATNWGAGLRLTVPLFSGMQSVYERREFRSRELQMELQAEALQKNLNLERVRAEQDFENARERESASLTALSQAREAVKVAQQSYQIGTSDYLQVSETQKQLADAERTYASSQFQVLEAYTKCYVAYGWPVQELAKAVESAVLKSGKE